ncbi:MAG TPA: hypothetical protein VGG38_10395 [Acidimicrobiales bacterium]|jgi:hypothetical protein
MAEGVRGRVTALTAYLPTALLTLGAGAFMTVGGDFLHTRGWGLAGVVLIPAGPLISIAFFLADRARGGSAVPPQTSKSDRRRLLLLLLVVGLPTPGGDISIQRSVGITGLMLVAGGAMFVAGYAIAAWTWALAPPLILVSGLVISLSFMLSVPRPST